MRPKLPKQGSLVLIRFLLIVDLNLYLTNGMISSKIYDKLDDLNLK